MVFTWVVGPILDLLTVIFSALPTGNTTFLGSPDTAAGYVSGWLGSASYFLPMGLLVTMTGVCVVTVIPALFVYEVVQWLYRELPDIAGFGPS